MLKRSFLYLTLIYSFFCQSHVLPMDLNAWAPPHVQTPELLLKLREINSKEAQQGQVPTLHDEKDEVRKRDFGFSVPGLNPAHEICLVKIKNEYDRSGKRPFLRDDGAGHGFMTKYMLIAGGHVTATELQKATALKLQDSIALVHPFLKENELLKNVCRTIVGSILSFESKKVYPLDQKYYLTWSGLLLHFLSPEQAQNYANKLFLITEPGGYVIAMVSPPCKNANVISYYREKERDGVLFPGYCVTDLETVRTYTAKTDKVELNSEKIIKIFPNTGTNLPGEIRHGYYGNETAQPERKTREHTTLKLVSEYHRHVFRHYIDHKALRNLFEGAGFDTEDLFYLGLPTPENQIGKISITDMTDKILAKNDYFLAIVAKKPGIS